MGAYYHAVWGTPVGTPMFTELRASACHSLR
jgi:hypothetical protein